jgi:MFS family permease
LEQKAKRIRQTQDIENSSPKRVLTVYESSEPRTWQYIFRKSLTRPFQLFYEERIVQLLGLYMAFIYGIFYLFLTTIPTIFSEIYHESRGIGGLHYIALGIGLSLSSQINARTMDRVYIHFKKKNGNVGEPEFRLPVMVPGSIILPIGLIISGWAATGHVHWVVTDLGIMFVGAGMILSFQAIQTYVVDAFTLHAASALAAVSCLRSFAGFGFPLFAPAMYAKLGYGKGDTILACLAIGLGCPAPFLLWKYGRQIRLGSKYAQKPPQQSHGQEKKKNGVVEPPREHLYDEQENHEKPGPLASTTTIAPSSQTPPSSEEKGAEKTRDEDEKAHP